MSPNHAKVTVHGLPAEYAAFLAQCRLSLRESSAAFAERKATLATRERLHAKARGIHYTSHELAAFLAEVTIRHIHRNGGTFELLDPACGDGALLAAFAQALSAPARKRLVLAGYETDPVALEGARKRLAGLDVAQVVLKQEDFLSLDAVASTSPEQQANPPEPNDPEPPKQYDAIIANPPYVRTQVLGGQNAQTLAKKFGLSGRIDLYQAFTRAMANVLKPGGVLGLLTSNRFLFVKSGISLRRLLRTQFDLKAVYDLGDTRPFPAAVLPAIVVARKQKTSAPLHCSFDRVYRHRSAEVDGSSGCRYRSAIEALKAPDARGVVRTESGKFLIERGVLLPTSDDEIWSLSTPEYERWLDTVRANSVSTFGEVGRIRIGIKTTADAVFIRDDWACLPDSRRPERELLRPLITHHDAHRWTVAGPTGKTRVLYPHTSSKGKCVPLDLSECPGAHSYLRAHRERLERRTYLIDAGRRWYEIWVPHNPCDWAKPKLVFPDIAEKPRCFLDTSGAIVNGDCYWITLRDGRDPDWLMLIMALVNSTLVTKYYDIVFHNKLYSGRRRFMTQYVARLPLPDLQSPAAKKAVALVRKILGHDRADGQVERRIDDLVWEAFGFAAKRYV